MITSKQRAYLRAMANELPAIMQIGKGGLTENMLKTFSDALEARELIKLHVLENSGVTPKEALNALAEALDAEAVAATGRKIEFKATSRFEGDLSSFGPKCQFDDLVFLRFKLDENLLYIYDLHVTSDEFGAYPANSKETIQQQKDQGRRPHISLQSLFVDAKGLQPDIIFDIRRCRIIEDNRR